MKSVPQISGTLSGHSLAQQCWCLCLLQTEANTDLQGWGLHWDLEGLEAVGRKVVVVALAAALWAGKKMAAQTKTAVGRKMAVKKVAAEEVVQVEILVAVDQQADQSSPLCPVMAGKVAEQVLMMAPGTEEVQLDWTGLVHESLGMTPGYLFPQLKIQIVSPTTAAHMLVASVSPSPSGGAVAADKGFAGQTFLLVSAV